MKIKFLNFSKSQFAIKIGVLFFVSSISAIPPINIFRPSDRPLLPDPWPGVCYQLTIGNESSFKSRAFQDDFEDCNFDFNRCPEPDRDVNVLRIYQDKQNLLAALKGFDSCSIPGQFLQKFNINDENGTQAVFVPSGTFKVPFNILLSSRYYFNHNLILALYLPVLAMELKNVRWCPLDSNSEVTEADLIRISRDIGGLDILGWKRIGIGDLIAQGLWMADFPQWRPLLRNVRPQIRLGLNFPTSKKQDEDKILALPFGNDGSWAVQLGGGLDLFFTPFARGGFDAEFLFMFGNIRPRRIKTACDQTDLLLFTKLPAFREYGLGQQFNLYFETCWHGLALKVNYQYLKREEDRLFVCSDNLDPFIINTAESLQDWTAHSFILSLKYDPAIDLCQKPYLPVIFGWIKLGFNGKRAILLDTLGATVTLSF